MFSKNCELTRVLFFIFHFFFVCTRFTKIFTQTSRLITFFFFTFFSSFFSFFSTSFIFFSINFFRFSFKTRRKMIFCKRIYAISCKTIYANWAIKKMCIFENTIRNQTRWSNFMISTITFQNRKKKLKKLKRSRKNLKNSKKTHISHLFQQFVALIVRKSKNVKVKIWDINECMLESSRFFS